MVKYFLTAANITLVFATFLFTGCSKKNDINAPFVTLNGSDKTISLQGTYVEEGATARDDKDGVLTPTVSGSVDTKHAGAYTLTYSATDAAGNTGTAKRTVIVKNDVASMAGIYNCTMIGQPNYEQTITPSSTINGMILFSRFGNYENNTAIYAVVTGTGDIILPSQTTPIKVGNGSDQDFITFTGNGTNFKSGVTTLGGFTLNYDKTTATSNSTLKMVESFEKK